MNEGIMNRLENIAETIEQVASQAGRDSKEIKILAASKTVSRACIDEAFRCGQALFGENRVQEALEKLSERPHGMRVDLIGHLQRNKVKKAVSFFQCLQSVDTLDLGIEIERRAREKGVVQEIMVELNSSGEDAKNGFLSWEELREAMMHFGGKEHLRVKGIMTIGPMTQQEDRVRSSFAKAREFFERTRSLFPALSCEELSMGMSSDYPLAIREGATMVRLGSCLFGEREKK